MKKIELNFSLVLVGTEYLKKFKEFTILSLVKNIENLEQKTNLTFYISTEIQLKKKITDLFKKKFKLKDYKIIFDCHLNIKNITYHDIGRVQNYHLNQIQKKNSYFIFLYSDIIYSNNVFKDTINILQKNNKISAVGSFAISLNTNNKFNIFFRKLLQNQNYLEYFLKNSFDLISNFHKKYIYGNSINLRSNFICVLKEKGLIIKSQHYHPIIIKPYKLNNNKIHILDLSFFELFKTTKEIYIEKNMQKLSIFSFDSTNSIRNKISYYSKKKINNNKEIFKKIYFIDLYHNLISNLNKFNFFLNNYVGFTFSQNLKIQSLNKFINYVLQKKINLIKYSINKNFSLYAKDMQKLKFKKFIVNYLIYFIKSRVIVNNYLIIRIIFFLLKINFINKDFKIGVINKDFKKANKNIEIFSLYIIIFMSYILINKLKFILNLVFKKKVFS